MNSNATGTSASVSVVVIGVENIDNSLKFYADTVGLEVVETMALAGPEFENYWQVPAGTTARCAFLKHGADTVGCVQLLEFDTPDRKLIRSPDVRRATGLFNLNLYTSDIQKDYEKLKAQGFEFWSEPAFADFGPGVGSTMEVCFDGPDGVVINLVELLTKDPQTMIGKLIEYVNEYGRTSTGFTQVVTTAHGVLDMEKALAFYYGPLGMKLFVDSVLEGAETNRALNLAEESRTHSVLVQGAHQYGKIALAQPMNYEEKSIVENAVPPNIGYLAQSFEVNDIAAVASACEAVGAKVFSPLTEIDLPGRGMCNALIVHNPGSGALQEIYQVL